jgi:protein phosphatase
LPQNKQSLILRGKKIKMADLALHIEFLSHKGNVRANNEDNFVVFVPGKNTKTPPNIVESSGNGLVMLVADGMGGANAGEVAADLAASFVIHKFQGKLPEKGNEGVFLTDIFKDAHAEIVRQSVLQQEWRGMGTTLVLIWIRDNSAHIVWCGDSRCYLFRHEQLRLLTSDHTVVNDYLKRGIITEEFAKKHPKRNILLQVLGDESGMIRPEYFCTEAQPGDNFLLCSDGLNGMISDEEIEKICNENQNPAENLLAAALQAGGSDNVTIITCKLQKKKSNRLKSTSILIILLFIMFFFAVAIQIRSCRDKQNNHILTEISQQTNIAKIDTTEQFSDFNKLSVSGNVRAEMLLRRCKILSENIDEKISLGKESEIGLREDAKKVRSLVQKISEVFAKKETLTEKEFNKNLDNFQKETEELEKKILPVER